MNPKRSDKASPYLVFLLAAAMVSALLPVIYAQLNDEVGRLIQAEGDVTIVTNDGRVLDAVNVLASAGEQGIPIKLGNKVITSEYSSAVIKTLDETIQSLHEMTSIQFGTASRTPEKTGSSFLERVGSFFMRQSGKAGDYRTQLVNTGWVDVGLPDEPVVEDE
ncbi:MAG: hypothetical protein KJT03_03570 [Verrucomicrobiae bacterium]|nr:hypothetical protein [Verrucomicrobiae bacterium]